MHRKTGGKQEQNISAEQECGRDTPVLELVINTQINTQSDIIIFNKIQTDIGRQEQLNKRILKKPIIQKLCIKALLPSEKDRIHCTNQLLNKVL